MRRTWLGAAASIGALLVLLPSPAGAHGSGAIQLVDASPSGPLEVQIQVCVAYADQHQAGEATGVTVRAQGPSTEVVDPAPMEPEGSEGLHTATVSFPSDGGWTVVVESTNPPATLSVPVTVGEDDRASPAVTAGGANVGDACAAEPDDLPTWLLVVGGGLAAIVVFGGLLWLMRRGGPSTPTAG